MTENESKGLENDPVFLGLTRPTMIMGVHYLFFVVNFMINIILFIITNSFVSVFVTFPVVHLAAYMVCLKEPRALELILLRYSKFSKCKNRMYHHFTNSYDPN